MNTVILPAMTYGAETWSLTKYQKDKLAVAQRSMERLMLNITRKDKIRNEVVRSKTQVKDIIKKVQNMKGQWTGHLARINNSGPRKQWNGHQEREAGRKEGLSGGGETTSKRKPEECGPGWHKIDKCGSSCGGHLPAVA